MVSAALQNGDIQKAHKLCHDFCHQTPDDAGLWLTLGKIEMHMGKLDAAKVSTRKAIELSNSLADAYFQQGAIYRALGRPEEAQESFESGLEINPDSADGYNRLGAALQEQGKIEQATIAYKKSVSLQPDFTLAHFNLGCTMEVLNKYAEAIECFRHAIEYQPEFAAAHLALGRCLQEQGNSSAAIEHCRKALEFQSDYTDASLILGLALNSNGQHAEAVATLHNMLQINPAIPEAQCALGIVLYSQGQADRAIACYRKALQLKSNYPEAHFHLGAALEAKGRLKPAQDSYQEALGCRPGYADAGVMLANIYVLRQRRDDAIAEYERVIKCTPDYHKAYIGLAQTLLQQGRREECMAYVTTALKLFPDEQEVRASTAGIYERGGKFENAYELLRPLLEDKASSINAAMTMTRICKQFSRCDDTIDWLEWLLENSNPSQDERRMLHFSLGSLLGSAKQFDLAFSHYQQGNQLKLWEYDTTKHARQVDELIKTFNHENIHAINTSSYREDRMIFIFGMPRSGTSLVEQILASHPEVYAGGEMILLNQAIKWFHEDEERAFEYPAGMLDITTQALDEIADFYLDRLPKASHDSNKVTDKLPGNFIHLGLIASVFPNAHLIHCTRDPLDSCLSCYFQDFSGFLPFTYDLAHLGAYYNAYQRMMDHWRQVIETPILEVNYESMVADPETMIHSIIKFCGLPWHEQCLDFHESDRVVLTASYDQVRRPIYRSSIGRWKNYTDHLTPLIAALKGHH